MQEGALKLLGGSLLITAGIIWVSNFPNLPALTGSTLGPVATSSTSGGHDIQQSYLACFFRSSLPISAGPPASGNYACPLAGKLNLVTFGAFGLLMLGAVVEGGRSGTRSPPPQSDLVREAVARRPIMPPKDYVKKRALRRSTRKRRRW